jgi:putative flippase GtrA
MRPNPMQSSFFRYLIVGICNTVFGYGCFALFTSLLTPLIPYAYVAASLIANLFAITFAFLGYKWFVFRTQGNYLREWIRCLGVYAGNIALSAAALPPLVVLVQNQTRNARVAPYIAGAIVLAFSVIISFFGHRHISFGGQKQTT